MPQGQQAVYCETFISYAEKVFAIACRQSKVDQKAMSTRDQYELRPYQSALVTVITTNLDFSVADAIRTDNPVSQTIEPTTSISS